MAEQTEKIIEENKMKDRIDVIHNLVEVSCTIRFIIIFFFFFFFFFFVCFVLLIFLIMP